MLKVTNFIALLKSSNWFPQVTFFNSTIDKSLPKCIGIYRRTGAQVMALGGPQNSSYDVLPVTILVHWTEDAGQCEDMANDVYNALLSLLRVPTPAPANIVITHVQLPDSNPVWVGRDEKNIAENVIRANIYYLIS